jgi:ubiquitin-protein ligase
MMKGAGKLDTCAAPIDRHPITTTAMSAASTPVSAVAGATAPKPIDYTPVALKRIARDTAKVFEEGPALGLFWIPADEDMGHGWAIVMGPVDTPYDGAPFCFEVRFPATYPFEPPVFTYLTNDGLTRFNPNLYKNGKVCLSLLNTWQGEPWSGIQSLLSVLQCLQASVLVDEPLRNEPGYSAMRTHTDFEPYKRMVFHSVLETAILRQLTVPQPYLAVIMDGVADWVAKARPRLLEKARALAAVWDGKTESMTFFQMTQKYRFGALATALEGLELPVGGTTGGATTEECEF